MIEIDVKAPRALFHPPPPPRVRPARKRSGSRVRRFAGILLLVAACIALVTHLAGWLHYRQRHVVTHDAAVRGVVSEIGARIDGQVAEVLVREGQRVTKGELIVTLQADYLRARIEEREAALERAERVLQAQRVAYEIEKRRRNTELDEARADKRVADADLAKAESQIPRWDSQHARISELVADGIMSTALLDEVIASRAAAHSMADSERGKRAAAGLRIAKEQVEIDGLREIAARIAVAEADVGVARASVLGARTDLEAATIRAPEDGWIAEIIAGPSASVRVGEPMVSMWLGERIWIDAWIDEEDLPLIDIGDPAEVALDAYKDQVVAGVVEAVPATTPEESRARATDTWSSPMLAGRSKVRLRIALLPPHIPLRPGLSAVVGISVSAEDGPVAGIPRSAEVAASTLPEVALPRVLLTPGVVIAAPHEGYDLHTGEIALKVAEAIGAPAVISYRKSAAKRFCNVNRPTSSTDYGRDGHANEQVNDSSRKVFEQWLARVADASPMPVPLYIEIHGNARKTTIGEREAPVDVIELATVGIGRGLAGELERRWEECRAKEPALPPLYVDMIHSDYEFAGKRLRFQYHASSAKKLGILQEPYVRMALHFELPLSARSSPDVRSRTIAALADLVGHFATGPAAAHAQSQSNG